MAKYIQHHFSLELPTKRCHIIMAMMTATHIDKPLPHSPEAERALLGGIILGGDGPWLDASEFFLPFHQSLCQALIRLKREELPIDLVLLNEKLNPRELEDCGGIAYVASLLDGFPRVANLDHYAKIIRDKASQRRAISIADECSRALWAAKNGNAGELLNNFISRLIATLPKEERKLATGLRAVSVSELLRMDVQPREMVLTPFLPTQGLAMLYSKRGVGKTYVALGISVAVASGTEFLKWKAPAARKVLYLDGEMPASALRQRVSDIIAGTNVSDPLDNLAIITPDLQPHGLPDLSTKEGQDQIEPHLDGVSLLVLDNLSSLVRDVKENEGEGWLPVQDWGLRLRRRGISVLFVHHAGKAGAQRGTSRREDLLDSVVTLQHPSDYNPAEGLRCQVHYEKSRGFYGDDAKPFEVKLMAGPSGEALWTVADPETSMDARIADMHRQGMSLRDIAEETGASKSKVHRIIKGLSHGSESRP